MIKRALAKLPGWLEVLIVISICFGYSIYSSIYSFASGAAFTKVEFTDGLIAQILIQEIMISAICVGFLYLRGYKIWERFRFEVSLKGIVTALGLFFATYAAYAVLWITASLLLGGKQLPVAVYTNSVTLIFGIAVSLVNPLFEEVFVVAYIFDKLQNHPVWIFVALSTAIRVSYHLYQGWVGIFSVLPLAIIFALAYWKTKNLMPLYFSHALMDLAGLLGRQ